MSTASHLQAPGWDLAKRESAVTLLFLPNPPLPRPPAAATVLPCTGLASATHGLHRPRRGPRFHLLTRQLDKHPEAGLGPTREAGPCNQRDPFQPRDPIKSCVSRKLDSWRCPPPRPACVPSRPGGGNETGEDARRPMQGTASLFRTHPALPSASIFHSTTQEKVVCHSWGSGPSTPTVSGQTGQALSSGRPGPVPCKGGAKGATGTELPTGSSRRKQWTLSSRVPALPQVQSQPH